MNRLARERSPYLLQHADNPVDWFPWGEDAFAKAREEHKPIFLSIGYSTCHWCHVMAHESFESEEVARVLNDRFVPIKVDREERPDVDRVYMTFVQATTGSGGWPMSVWLTPDLKPFYGGTYFPPNSRWGRPGFVDILGEIARVWEAEPDKVQQSAESMTSELEGISRPTAPAGVPGPEALVRAVAQFRGSFDSRHGGFGDAPKFPRASELLFLFREHARTGDAEPRDMALRTLGSIAFGGMRDHIGGGFHRYSVDSGWRVPHFEKMLYDQAQLALVFVEAAQIAGDPFYLQVAEDTVQYVLREMTDDGGGFYSAEDADSVPPEEATNPRAHKAEGAFYLWRAEEIDALVGDDALIVKRRFGIEPDGNAPVDPQHEFTGKNLLYIARSFDAIAEEVGKSSEEVAASLTRARVRLFEKRVERPRPHLDDKVLTAWNGLMIAALARTARVRRAIGDAPGPADDYLLAAQRAATFIRRHMWNGGTSILLRRYRDGASEIEGYAEDYAYLIFGLLELFQADSDVQWLDWALVLQRRQNELFGDDAVGGWFSTTGHDPTVLLRMKEDYDGAEPTASSVSVLNLVALSHLVPDQGWNNRIERTFGYFATRLEQTGRAVPMMAAALSTYLAGLRQIVLVSDSDEVHALERAVAMHYLPFDLVLRISPGRQASMATRLPFVASMRAIHGSPTAYVCRDFTCRAPIATVAELERELSTKDFQ